MMVYKYGSDVNFLNTTSLTRSAFNQLLRRFSRFYYIPRHTTRGRPTKLKHHHQNFRVQQPSNADLQNAMYNGWLHTVLAQVSLHAR
ncbi:hypothetical protein PF005_g27192 [Phytophthora fragariae]|nr:hypothetical protein PF005_g27192 [Phytophthora fragariae]